MEEEKELEFPPIASTHIFTGTAFILFNACAFCGGRGVTHDAQAVYNLGRTHADLACTECKGVCGTYRYLFLNELFRVLMPAMIKEFERQLPEIIQRAELELVRAIMEC